jgi:hypothetical protein
MSRRSTGLVGLSIAALVGATVAPLPASAATTTTTVTRDGVSVVVTHVDGSAPTTDKHPLSRYDFDGDGKDDIVIEGLALQDPDTRVNIVAIRLSRTGAIERIAGDSTTTMYTAVVADFDGDGFGDLAATEARAPERTGGVWIFYGGLGGFDLSRTGHFTQATNGVPRDPAQGAFFGSSSAAADFTGDGRADLALRLSQTANAVVILPGSASGLTATGLQEVTPAQVSLTPGDFNDFGLTLAAGDVTGDGRPDLAIGSSAGPLLLLRNSANGFLLTTPSALSSESVGNLIAGFGKLDAKAIADVNGDGFGDLVASDWGAVVNGAQGAGTVVVFYGNAQGIAAQRRTLLHKKSAGVSGDPAASDLLGDCVSAGDVTGDGYADLVIGSQEMVGTAPGAGAIYVFRGSAQGVHSQDNQVFTQDSPNVPGEVGLGHVFCDSAILDLDGTGPLDVLATAVWGNVVATFSGGSAGLTATGELDTTQIVPDGLLEPVLIVTGAATASTGAATASAGSSVAAIAGRTATAAGLRAAAGPVRAPAPASRSGTLPTTVDGPTSARAALVPVSTAARFDFDGDGKDDAVVTTYAHLTVRYSRSGRIDVLSSPGFNDLIGRQTAAGDFDSDGYADLAISDPADNLGNPAFTAAGSVWVCRGSADGLLYDECLHIAQSTPGINGVVGAQSHFGDALAAGDFTGDGYADLAIGTPGEAVPSRLRATAVGTRRPAKNPKVGSVTLLYGGADGLRADRSRRLVPAVAAPNASFGAVLSAGDVTGDGIADLAVSMLGVRLGTVDLYAGAHGGVATTPISQVAWTDMQGTLQAGFGYTLSIADTNADGRGDVLVGAPYATFGDPWQGAVIELRGQASGITAAARRVVRPGTGGVPSITNVSVFGNWIATGDANGDGYADLVIGVPVANLDSQSNPAGMIMVLPGSAAGLTGTGLVTAAGPAGAQGLGSSVAMLNSDGTGGLEVLAGAPYGDAHQSSKIGAYYEYRFTGSALTLIATTPAAAVGPPSTAIYDFGLYALHQ